MYSANQVMTTTAAISRISKSSTTAESLAATPPTTLVGRSGIGHGSWELYTGHSELVAARTNFLARLLLPTRGPVMSDTTSL